MPFKRIGKILVATDESQIEKLRAFQKNAKQNGVSEDSCCMLTSSRFILVWAKSLVVVSARDKGLVGCLRVILQDS